MGTPLHSKVATRDRLEGRCHVNTNTNRQLGVETSSVKWKMMHSNDRKATKLILGTNYLNSRGLFLIRLTAFRRVFAPQYYSRYVTLRTAISAAFEVDIWSL